MHLIGSGPFGLLVDGDRDRALSARTNHRDEPTHSRSVSKLFFFPTCFPTRRKKRLFYGHFVRDARSPALPAAARAASGQVAAAPPRSVMRSRRFMCPVPRYGAACPAGLPRTQGITEGPAGSLGQT